MAALVSTTDILQAKRSYDVDSAIHQLRPDITPFLTISRAFKGGPRTVTDPKFFWLEDDVAAFSTTVSTDYTSTSASNEIVVADSSVFLVQDIIYNAKSLERMRITVIVNSTTLTVVRGFPLPTSTTSTGLAAGTATNVLIRLGNLYPEGAASRDGTSGVEVEKFNYTQIIRTPYSITNTMKASKLRVGKDELGIMHAKKAMEHKIEIERFMLFGMRNEETAIFAKTSRTMGGLFQAITTNVTVDSDGTLTESEFNDFLETIFRYGSKRKLMLGGGTILKAINSWGKSDLQIDPNWKKYGLDLKEYFSPFGSIGISFAEEIFRLSTQLTGTAVVIDPANVRFVILRPTKKVQIVVDMDGEKWEYVTECSLQVTLEKTHGVLKGAIGYAA